MKEKKITAAGKERVVNVRQDSPDLRDRPYEPALIPLAPELDHRDPDFVLDQGREGACTGFGAAAVINMLLANQGSNRRVSARMLYEMAQKHDEWPGEDYDGSSCRGAIRGWKNMGVCSDELWPYDANKPGSFSIAKAKDARSTILGAYYRLRPNLNDYHAALNETGAIYVSAGVHDGWNNPPKGQAGELAQIRFFDRNTGGHAFAIVGYNEFGFIVQNSWGPRWGSQGFALWAYEDWAANVYDAWVFRLAVSTPNVFGLTAKSDVTQLAELGKKAPKRIDIAGHFAHFDDGYLLDRGDYWSNLQDIQLTIDRVGSLAASSEIEHLLIYAHGGLNSPKASASRIRALKDGFLRNGIYPFHIMYDTGLAEELTDVIFRAFTRSQGIFEQWRDRLEDASDKIIEGIVKAPGTALWKEMKFGASSPFVNANSDGVQVINGLITAVNNTSVKVHLVGHSTGAIVLGHMLQGIDQVNAASISSCSLLAPACSTEFYKSKYAPRIKGNNGISSIDQLDLYNLNEQLELDDNVAKAYRKSLLYLVSRAFEQSESPKPLLGMRKYSKKIRKTGLKHITSKGTGTVSSSTTHGGFDNDLATMNTVLKRILPAEPAEPFLEHELDY